jgi:hypothetical protein
MTNVMHKFLIYLSVYFCLKCFGLYFSQSSEAGVQIRQWFMPPGYGVSARALKSYPGGLNLHYVGHYTVSFQNARSLQDKM